LDLATDEIAYVEAAGRESDAFAEWDLDFEAD